MHMLEKYRSFDSLETDLGGGFTNSSMRISSTGQYGTITLNEEFCSIRNVRFRCRLIKINNERKVEYSIGVPLWYFLNVRIR
jgi:hypothetical protein